MIVTNNIKYHAVTPSKQVEDLCDKNIRSVKEDDKEDTKKKWKDLPCSWVGRLTG